MTDHAVSAQVKSVVLTGRVLRADGTVEELGTLAEWHDDDQAPHTATAPGKVTFTYGE